MKLELLQHGVIANNEVLPQGTLIEVGEHRAKHLIKAGAARLVEDTPEPKPINVTINTTVNDVEVAATEVEVETPEPKPKRRRRKVKAS
jgi:hypothetical protein